MSNVRNELRRKEICKLLEMKKHMSVNALAERFTVSAMTIRRDLDMLEDQQMLRREHGRAVYIAPHTDVAQYDARLHEDTAAKAHIAQMALPFLAGVESIYLDGSTTSNALLSAIPDDITLTVYTNSLPALNMLVSRPRLKAFMFGGMLSESMQYLDSTSSLFRRNDIFVDIAFISCTGYDPQRIINHNILPVNERRIMLKNANKRFLLADSKKRGKSGMFTVCGWDSIDGFITNEQPDAEMTKSLTGHGVQIIY